MISALNKQIDSVSGGENELVVFLNYDLFTTHIPHDYQYDVNSNLMKQYLYDDFGLRTIVAGSYALEGFELSEPVDDHRTSYHPNTLSGSGYRKDSEYYHIQNLLLHTIHGFRNILMITVIPGELISLQ